MSYLLRLYPAPWRQRYGEEFLALISERPQSLDDRVDIVRGAIDARLHPQVDPPEPVVADRAGFAVLVGLGLFVAGILLAISGPVQEDEYGTYRDGAAAWPFFIGAMALLSVGLYRLIERLPLERLGTRSAAWTAIITGTFWSIIPWGLMVGLIFFVAILAFAIGAWRAGLLSSWVTAAFGLAVLGPIFMFVIMFLTPWYANRDSNAMLLLLPMAGLWLLVGFRLLRGFPPRAVEPAA
jgi:MFS family permease